MTGLQTFEEHGQAIAENFLHTALIVDDRAILAREPTETADEADGTDTPGGRGVEILEEPPGDEGPDHDLDLKALGEAFASRGVLCAALSPEKDDTPESIADKMLPPAGRADLVILDWVLNGDNGERTKALLEKLLAHDGHPLRHRLRTVAIYTGQPTLNAIADDVAGILGAAYPEQELQREPRDALDMTKGPIRIVVLAKPDVEGAPADRRVEPGLLPERLSQEFAAMTRGLVLGVALAALAALRADTHRLLRLLGPKLDSAYLGHRSAQGTPGEAEDHLVSMVAAEIAAVLADHDLGENADIETIKLWITAQRESREGFRFGQLIGDKNLTDDQLETLLGSGIEALAHENHRGLGEKYLRNQLKRDATRLFCSANEQADEANAEFFARMTLRTQYARPPRALTLGTIVEKDGEWLICVQPVCDSARLGMEVTSFPFFPLGVVDPTGDADFVAQDDSGWKWLKLMPDPKTLRLLRFDADSAREMVLAVPKRDQQHWFIDDKDISWRWAAELKPDHAQRVAFQVGQRFARVGLDEPEILRLSRAGKRSD